MKVSEARDEGRGVGEEQQLGRQQGDEEEEDKQVSCCVLRDINLVWCSYEGVLTCVTM